MNEFSSQLHTLLESGKLKNWQDFFECEIKKPYFHQLECFLNLEYQNATIFPPVDKIFSAFTICDLREISTVILGQDPYHEKNQAVGLAFSVAKTYKIPPSLRNIYKELQENLGVTLESGDISHWGAQGVFLLNTALTVREGFANSHARKGWEIFTKNAISHLVHSQNDVIFMLFGKPAEKFEGVILQNDTNHIIKTSHPSPLSAYRGFLGSGVFSKANDILIATKRKINWDIQK